MSEARPKARLARWLTIAASLVIGAAIWEVAGQFSNPSFMAPLLGSEILGPLIGTTGHPGTLPRLVAFIEEGEFLGSLASSLLLFATGFAIALAVAIPFGLVLARLALLRVALEDYILVLYVTPMVAMIPFILAIIGFDFWPKVLVVALFAFFPTLYNTLEGARSVKPELIEVAQSFRTSEWALWRDVLVPYTLPYALTGVRQATGRALVGMIAAEFFLSTSGLGQEIMVSSRNFDMAGVLATIIVITLLGVGLMRLVQACEARFAVWRGLDR